MRQLQVFVKELDLDGGGEFNSTLPCPLSTYVLVVVGCACFWPIKDFASIGKLTHGLFYTCVLDSLSFIA